MLETYTSFKMDCLYPFLWCWKRPNNKRPNKTKDQVLRPPSCGLQWGRALPPVDCIGARPPSCGLQWGRAHPLVDCSGDAPSRLWTAVGARPPSCWLQWGRALPLVDCIGARPPSCGLQCGRALPLVDCSGGGGAHPPHSSAYHACI